MTTSDQYELKILLKAEQLIQEKPLAELLALKGFKLDTNKSIRYALTGYRIHYEKNKQTKIIYWGDLNE